MLKRMRCAIAVWCWVPICFVDSMWRHHVHLCRDHHQCRLVHRESTQRAIRSRTLQSKAVYAWVEADDGLGVVTNWDSDIDQADLLDRMETHQDTGVDYNNKYSNKPLSKDSLTQLRNDTEMQTRLRKREESHRRRRGFRMPRGSGATSDGVCFSIPTNHNEKAKRSYHLGFKYTHTNLSQQVWDGILQLTSRRVYRCRSTFRFRQQQEN